MAILRAAVARIVALFRRRELDRQLDDELQFHLEGAVESHLAAGMSEVEARRRARLDLGGASQLRDSVHDANGLSFFDSLAQDTRFAFRMLRKNPGLTVVAVLTLALGVGANTAIFSLVHAVLLKPLPYPDSERLVVLQGTRNGEGADAFRISEADYRDWEKQTTVFEGVALCTYWSFNVTGIENPERIVGMAVTGNFFPLLGVQPALGRALTPEDDRPGAAPVVVLSYPLWQRMFGGRTDVLGRSITLNSQPTTIVGVMPRGFAFPVEHAYMWTAIADNMQGVPRTERFLMSVGRLRGGVTLSQAQSEMDVISRRLEAAYPESNKGWGVRLATAHDTIVGEVRSSLILLGVAVGLVLLISCANLANLLLARMVARQKELAIRAALGAGHWRLVRQTLTENLVLTFLGGAFALVVASQAVRAIQQIYPSEMPRLGEAGVNVPVLAFAIALCVTTAVVLGLLSAARALDINTMDALKQGGTNATQGVARERLRKSIVVAQITISVVLLIGGGLLVRSLHRVLSVDPGFRAENVITFSLWLTGGKFRDVAVQNTFIRDLLQNSEAIPGVQSAAAISQIPMSQGGRTTLRFRPIDQTIAAADSPRADYRAVSPGFFSTLGIPLIEGHDFSSTDQKDSQRVVIVNQRLARQWWGAQSPIGKQIRWTESSRDVGPLTVIGVAGDVRAQGLEKEDELAVYVPYTQRTLPYLRWTGFAIRTRVAPMAVWPLIREQVLRLDADRALYDIQTAQTLVAKSVAERRFNTLLLGFFCCSALLLAAIGIYGLISYAVSQRVREFGIRIALGARSRDVLSIVLREGLTLALAGIGIGLALAFYAANAMTRFLYGLDRHDPVTFAGIPILLALIALVACYIPARRATAVDPMIAIRNE